MQQLIQRSLTRVGTSLAHPAAFLMVPAYAALWLAFDPGTLDWTAGTGLATWTVALFIQRAQYRDAQALHQKLDELIRSQPGAREEFTEIDRRQPERIEAHRAKEGGEGGAD